MTAATSHLSYKPESTDQDTLLLLHKRMLYSRMIEEKMLALLRQGRITKWFSGMGQEAIATGVITALHSNEYVLPLHRNLGIFTGRSIPLQKLAAQWMGKADGFTKGRDRSFHFGSPEHYITGMISHLGANLPMANGYALAEKLSGRQKVSVAFSGDGGTSQGDFHEALNIAAVWQLPVIFVIENNGYGLSTPVSEQYRCQNLADRGIGYGMKSVKIDGNNVIEVYETINELAHQMRQSPEPVLVEAVTFRMRGHEEASGTKYVPAELLDEWSQKDPIANYEAWLKESHLIDELTIENIKTGFKSEIDEAIAAAFAQPDPQPGHEIADVYADNRSQKDKQAVSALENTLSTDIRFIDAISAGLKTAMQQHDNLVLMGQDIADYGGVFKVTDGLLEEFGAERVRNTPLCESGVLGTAAGLAAAGYKVMVEMQFADFVSCGFNQIVNNIAKLHYRWQQKLPLVIRMPTGGGTSGGPFHSQSTEAWFCHVPGLKIYYPSTPEDAKGLLIAAFNEETPSLFFEHKKLYRSLVGSVPDKAYETNLTQARIAMAGQDLSIITYGAAVQWAVDAAKELGISADIIDLRVLQPWDKHTVAQSVKKTGKALVCHEDSMTGGFGAEIAAWVGEHCFEQLDAPVMRVASLDTPVPFAAGLENDFLPIQRLREQLKQLSNY